MKKIVLCFIAALALSLSAARAQITVTVQSHLVDLEGNAIPDGPMVLSLYTLNGAPEDTFGDGSSLLWENASLTLHIGESFTYHSDAIEAGFSTTPGGSGFLALGLDNTLFQEYLLSPDTSVMSGGLLQNSLELSVFDSAYGFYVGDEIFAWEIDNYFIDGSIPSVPASAVPEPSTYGLIGAAVLCLGVALRRRFKR